MTIWLWLMLVGWGTTYDYQRPLAWFCCPMCTEAQAVERARDPRVRIARELHLHGCQPIEVDTLVAHGSMPGVQRVDLAPGSLDDATLTRLLSLRMPVLGSLAVGHTTHNDWFAHNLDTLAPPGRTDPLSKLLRGSIGEGIISPVPRPSISVFFGPAALGQRLGRRANPKMGRWLKRRFKRAMARMHPLTLSRINLLLRSDWAMTARAVAIRPQAEYRIVERYDRFVGQWMWMPTADFLPLPALKAGTRFEIRPEKLYVNTCGCDEACLRTWLQAGLADAATHIGWHSDLGPSILDEYGRVPGLAARLKLVVITPYGPMHDTITYPGCGYPLTSMFSRERAELINTWFPQKRLERADAWIKAHDMRPIAKFFGNPAMTNLEYVEMPGMPLDDAALTAFAKVPHPKLHRATLVGNFGDKAAALLVRSRSMQSIDHLRLAGAFQDEGLAAFGDSPYFEKLRVLDLVSTRCPTDAAMAAFARSKMRPEELEFSGFSVRAENAIAIGRGIGQKMKVLGHKFYSRVHGPWTPQLTKDIKEAWPAGVGASRPDRNNCNLRPTP